MGRNFRRGLRKAVAPLAVLGLMAGGAVATLSVSAASATPSVEVPCDNANTDQAATDSYSHVLAVCKSGPESAVAGTDVEYTVTVYASGHYDHNFEVTDDIPQGTTFVSADGGGTWDCGFDDPTVTCTADDVSGSDINGSVITVTVHVPSSFTDEGIENCASIQKVYEPKGIESDGYNWTWTSCWDTEITREFDVSIEKTGPASLVVPANAVYTITASNAGPSDSDLVSFTDPVPAGTTLVGVDGGTAWDCSATTATEVDCTTLDGIPAGESVSATVTLSVPIEHAGTALENCATLASDEPSAAAVGQSCTTIEGANVTVKAAEVIRPVTGVSPKFTG